MDIRLGGIYALERIARDSWNDHPQVVEVLTAYVREHSRDGSGERPKLPTDGQAAMTVLGRRDASQDSPGTRLDLAHTNLRGANLVGANLQRALLSSADLQHGLLRETNLKDAILMDASVEEAHLEGANLETAG